MTLSLQEFIAIIHHFYQILAASLTAVAKGQSIFATLARI